MESQRGPAAAPCRSCPYRRDVPSGVWDETEYEKLPSYDRDTPFQHPGAFFCHQEDGRLCAGWVGCHDMSNNLGLRLCASAGVLDEADVGAALNYESPVPLWPSGAAAAEHGLREILDPPPAARRAIDRLERRRSK